MPKTFFALSAATMMGPGLTLKQANSEIYPLNGIFNNQSLISSAIEKE